MKKNLLALLLVCCIVLGMLPAASAATSGTYNDDIQWSFDENSGVLTLSGAGDMVLSDSGYPWLAYKDKITSIEFDESLTKIGDEAFYGCTALKKVNIPGTVKEIGSFAFAACTALESVVLSDGVEIMSSFVFSDCTALKQVTLSATVDRMDSTFKNCTALEHVIVPEGVTELVSTFAQCYNLISVDLPSTVEAIMGAFADCRSLSSLELPDGLRVIGENAFFGCISLGEMIIPATVDTIQGYAFCGGKDANGAYQKGIDPIYFLGDAPLFNSNTFDGDVFSQEITCYYPDGNATWTKDVLQDYGGDVNWVAYNPDTMEPIEPDPSEPDPTEPSTPDDPDHSGICGEDIFWKFYPDTGTLYIYGSGTMTTNDYGSPWKHLRDKILRIEFAPEVTNIGDYAFKALKSLDKVAIPAHIISIGQGAFESCTSLNEVVIKGPVTELRNTFNQCRGLRSVALPDTVETMVDTFSGCESLETVDLPNNLKVMNNVFRACYKLKEVNVPEGVVDIDGSFWQCRNLTKVELPDSVENLGSRTFGCCHSLKMLTIPKNVKYIGYWAFDWVEILHKNPSVNGVQIIFFTGDAPEFDAEAFYSLNESKITCYYPQGNNTWTKDVLQNYGGNVTWKAYDPAEAGNPFTDVKSSDYYFEPVMWALQNNITAGTSANRFSPNMTCTRGQVVTFLWRAAGEPEPVTTQNPFTDVKPSDYFYKAVLWAVENNITSGTGNGKFSPNMACSRAQVATFLWRANGEPEPLRAENPFTDVKASAYYYKAVLWAVENGVTSGTGNGKFSPDMACSRGQIVTFLYRAYQ